MNHIYFVAGILCSAILFFSWSSNPPNGYTGAPGESTCANCHSGGGNINGDLQILGLPGSITPGQVYTITLLINNSSSPLTNAVRGGFQLVALDQNNTNVGTLSSPSTSSVLMMSSGRNYWEHNPYKNFNGGSSLSWTVNWEAPPVALGQMVTMYAASVLANGNGNSGGDRVEITEASGNLPGPPPLNATISNFKNISCFGGSDGFITVNATNGLPPYTYEWSNGQNTATANNLQAGNHTVTVSDQIGGMVVLNRNLTQPTEIKINSSAGRFLLNCHNDNNGFINLSITGGVSPYTYKWSNGPTTRDITNLKAGDYTVTVKDNTQCEQTRDFTIDQPDPLDLNGLILTSPDCIKSNTGHIQMTVSGGNFPYSYKWSSGETTSSIQDKLPGNYSCTVTDQKACIGIQSIQLKVIDNIKPRIIASPQPRIYLDSVGKAILQPQFFIKNVIDNCDTGIVIRPEFNLVNCQNLGQLPLKIYATDLAGNSDSGIISILVFDTLAPFFVLPPNITISDCSDTVPHLITSDNCLIKEIRQLEGPSEGFLFNEGLNNMRYEIEDFSGNISKVNYSVLLNNPLEFNLDTILYDRCTGKDPKIILNMLHTLDSSFSLSYNECLIKYFDTITDYILNSIPDTNFILSIRDTNLCSRSIAFDINYKELAIKLLAAQLTDPTNCITTDGSIVLTFEKQVYRGTWLDANFIIIPNQTGQNLAIGKYYFRASDLPETSPDECVLTFGPFELRCLSNEVAIDKFVETFLVFPNPSNDRILNLDCKLSSSAQLQIINSNGSIIFTKNKIDNGFHQFEIPKLSSGLYLVKLETNQGSMVKRWMVLSD
ncbi:MAG: T9SS type A sorting domain-containing protein [Saprospiraceae bacterium]|nr:T9SS type A sorting domain-containing protein [Saprospiraceae bacterium]